MTNQNMKEDLLKKLQSLPELYVTFEKKDGSIREMRCTLKDVPEYEKKTTRVKKQSEEVLAVFDLDKEEWRSFRLDSVKYYSFASVERVD